jgi:mono/diheme cytochrome c family protein
VKAIATALAICISFLAASVVLAQIQNTADKPAAGAAPKYDPAVYAELQKAPEKARNRANPLQNDPDAVAAGAILFQQHCAECHGSSAQGSRKAPNLLAPEVQKATPGTLFWLITNGVVRKKMPVWSKLPEAQRWQLVRYIQSLGAAAPESPAPKP